MSFDGVRFTLDARVASGVVYGRVEACRLKQPSDKPDGVSPAHVAFRFGADAQVPETCAVPRFDSAGLYVFPADGFRRELASAAASLAALEKLLAARSLPAGKAMPFVPFVDASFAVVERARFIDFQGGTGLLVLAELSIEPDTLGDELVFVFQGLSRDGARYVLGIFPATTSAPAIDFSVDPDAPFQEQVAAFEPYRRRVAASLAAARDAAFSPRPSRLRAMLASLRL